jgi:hypothetical protein
MDHLRELLLLAEPLYVTQMLARCLNVIFTVQGLRYNTAAIIGQRLEAATDQTLLLKKYTWMARAVVYRVVASTRGPFTAEWRWSG